MVSQFYGWQRRHPCWLLLGASLADTVGGMHRFLALPLLMALIAGCGGGESDEQQLRDELAAYTRDLVAGDFADACRRTADPKECIVTLRAAEVLAGGREELLVAWGATEEVVEAAGRAVVTVRGDRATVDNPATSDRGVEAVRRDGRWRLVAPSD